MVAMRVLEARASCVWVRVPPSAPYFGSLAQLVERLPYTQNVGSSNLSRPTSFTESWPSWSKAPSC
jgi:hypothetical protein